MTDPLPWWEALADHIARREDRDGDVDDPWADVALPAATLTPEQITYLAQLEDQPPVPRLRGVAEEDESAPPPSATSGDATGNSPGDQPPCGGVRSHRD
jgi:hypothetical protein